MEDLRTDYKDDVLNITTNERRKYRMINNADGTVSFEDVTDYVVQGDTFGATEVNQITEKVNSCLTREDIVDNLESTATDLPLSANMGRELKDNLPIVEKDGNWFVYKYPDGNFIAVLAWTTGNTIPISTSYGTLYISTVFALALPQNTRTVIKVSGNTTYLGGGIGGISVSDKRNNIANHDDINFYIWSVTNITARVDASFMCFGEWK